MTVRTPYTSSRSTDRRYTFVLDNGAPPPPSSSQGSGSSPSSATLGQGSSLPPSGPQRLDPVRLTSEVARPTTFPRLRISVNARARLNGKNDGILGTLSHVINFTQFILRDSGIYSGISSLLFVVASRPANGVRAATLTGGPARSTYVFGALGQVQTYDTPNARASTTEGDEG